jgi:hypothetical protein
MTGWSLRWYQSAVFHTCRERRVCERVRRICISIAIEFSYGSPPRWIVLRDLVNGKWEYAPGQSNAIDRGAIVVPLGLPAASAIAQQSWPNIFVIMGLVIMGGLREKGTGDCRRKRASQ